MTKKLDDKKIERKKKFKRKAGQQSMKKKIAKHVQKYEKLEKL